MLRTTDAQASLPVYRGSAVTGSPSPSCDQLMYCALIVYVHTVMLQWMVKAPPVLWMNTQCSSSSLQLMIRNLSCSLPKIDSRSRSSAFSPDTDILASFPPGGGPRRQRGHARGPSSPPGLYERWRRPVFVCGASPPRATEREASGAVTSETGFYRKEAPLRTIDKALPPLRMRSKCTGSGEFWKAVLAAVAGIVV